jgi:hypothetical protein
MTCPIDTTCTYPSGQCHGGCAVNFTTRRVRAGMAPAVAPMFVKAAPRKACAPAVCEHRTDCADTACPGHPQQLAHTARAVAQAKADPGTPCPAADRALFAVAWLVAALVAAGLVITLT